jgi:hypothetical protein
MKGLSVLLLAGLTLGGGEPASAQPLHPPGPVARADASGLLGYLGSEKPFDRYNDWDHSLFGGGTFGWYWTDHLKTEVEAGVSTRSEKHAYFSESVGTRFINRESTFRYSTRRLAIGQQYQFFRNAMFHPYLGGGIELTWEKTEREDSPASIFDTSGRLPVPGNPAVVHPDRTELVPRGYAATGFKAYVSPKAFFRSDLKLAFGSGVEEVLLRVGFGVDF